MNIKLTNPKTLLEHHIKKKEIIKSILGHITDIDYINIEETV